MGTITDVRGKRVLLTGAAGPLGRATARRLAEAGADLALVDRDPVALADAVEALADTRRTVVSLVCDLRDERHLADLRPRMEDVLGPPDVLITHAGAAAPSPLIQSVVPGMRDRNRGQVVVVAASAATLHRLRLKYAGAPIGFSAAADAATPTDGAEAIHRAILAGNA